MIRAVVDANVFVSAVLSPRGQPAEVLRAWRAEQFHLVISAPILEEVERVFHYSKIVRRHRRSTDAIRVFIEDLANLAILTPGLLTLQVITEDRADDRYLECAVEGEASYIVSEDQHLLRLGAYDNIRILTPGAFLDILREKAKRRGQS